MLSDSRGRSRIFHRVFGRTWRPRLGASFCLAGLTFSLLALAQDPEWKPEALNFSQVVQRALAQNVTVLVNSEEVRRAQALVEQARSSSFPSLIGNGLYTRLDAARKFDTRIVAGQDQISGNVTFSLPLLAPQRWAQWSRASQGEIVSEANLEDARRQIAISAARAYLSVLGQHRVVEASERARDTARAHVNFSKARLTGGVGNRLDEVRAEQELNSSEAQLQNAVATLVRLQGSLGVLIGHPEAVDAVKEPTLNEPPTIAQGLKFAEERRTDVELAMKRLQAADKSLNQSWTDYMPLLSAVFQPFFQNPPSLVQPRTGWQAQLVLTVPFYDGGQRYGLTDERRAVAAESRFQLENAVRQARSEVRAGFEQVKKADSALKASREAAKSSQEALRLATLAYQAGATTNLEVIDAERRARDAETTAAISEDSARQARLDLLAASGKFP